MQLINKPKVITCILPQGVAFDVIKKIKQEKQIPTANVNFARGLGKLTPLSHRGVGEQREKEILTLVVPGDKADEMFEFIYDIADINRPHGGIIYISKLKQATPYILPEIPEEA